MKILITGATGFIGSYVIRMIPSSIQVMAISRNKKRNNKNINWIKCSLDNLIRYKKKIITFNPDCLIHLAWEGIPVFSKTNCKKNLFMSKSLIKLLIASTNINKIIISGTCFEYKNDQGECYENTEIKPKNEFIKSKLKLYRFVNKLTTNKKINFYWLRLFYVYGPGQRRESLIPFCINKIKRGFFPSIKNPQNKNDFIYVKDVAKAILLFIKKKPNSGIYNVGSGKPIILKSLIELIWIKIQKKKIKLKIKKSSNNSEFWSNIDKIKKKLDWKPTISLNEGIKRTILDKPLQK